MWNSKNRLAPLQQKQRGFPVKKTPRSLNHSLQHWKLESALEWCRLRTCVKKETHFFGITFPLGDVLVQAAVTNSIYWMAWATKIYFPHFWRLEVQNEGRSKCLLNYFLFCRWLSVPCTLIWWRAEGDPRSLLFIRALILSWDYPHDLI